MVLNMAVNLELSDIVGNILDKLDTPTEQKSTWIII